MASMTVQGRERPPRLPFAQRHTAVADEPAAATATVARPPRVERDQWTAAGSAAVRTPSARSAATSGVAVGGAGCVELSARRCRSMSPSARQRCSRASAATAVSTPDERTKGLWTATDRVHQPAEQPRRVPQRIFGGTPEGCWGRESQQLAQSARRMASNRRRMPTSARGSQATR
jgi:hypothetical protein